MAIEKVTVIIVNYKTSHLIQGLLDSFQEDPQKISINFIVVDNASTDETFNELDKIKKSYIQILRSSENLGFTGGINLALKHIINTNQEFKYFVLFNPDAFSCPDLIFDLTSILLQNKNAACISPKIVHLNGDPWFSGSVINFTEGRVLDIPPLKQEINLGQDYYETDVFNGCTAVFDLEKVLETGMFNEDLFMYFDEAEMSIRLKKKGFKILFSSKHKVFHDVSYSTRKISHLKTYYMTRNKFMVFNETMNFSNKVYFILYELAFHLKNKRIKNAYYHLKGYFDFLKGKKGSYLNF
jgi:GT2 family glycosyltransferase